MTQSLDAAGSNRSMATLHDDEVEDEVDVDLGVARGGKLSDAEAAKVINGYIKAIKDKAEAQYIAAEDEYMAGIHTGIAKDVQDAKARIDAEMEKGLTKMKSSLAIKKSLGVNAARLAKISKQQDRIGNITTEVRAQTANLAQDQEFVCNLVVQSCLMLLEDKVVVRCRPRDVTVVNAVLDAASAKYHNIIHDQAGKSKNVALEIDQSKPLPDDCSGGVICSVRGGDIQVDNTIDARLDLVMEQDKPAIRNALFQR